MIFAILEQSLIAAPLVIGAYLSLSLLKVPDLSIESSYVFGAALAFTMQDYPLPIMFISSITGGMIVGFSTAALNQLCKIPFLLAAIIVNGFYHGFIQFVLGSSMMTLTHEMPQRELLMLFLIAAATTVVICFILRSQMGFSLAIYGNNPHFFANHKMDGNYIVMTGVSIGGGLAGLSGFLFAQSNGFVDITMGYGLILLCLTALVLGRVILRSKRSQITVPLIGVIAYFTLQQCLLTVGFDLRYFNSIQSLSLLGALMLLYTTQHKTIDHLGV